MDYKLQVIYQQIPKSSCPPDCGRCCGPVFPSLAELRNIEDWCETHHVEYKGFLDIGDDGACPYLGQHKECIIYPVRPFLCRILAVSTDLPCPIRACTTNKMLNHPQSDALYSAIYLRGKEKPRTERHRTIVKEVIGAVAPELLQ